MTVEKEETSIFQEADLATTVVDMSVKLYCYNYCFKRFVRTLVSAVLDSYSQNLGPAFLMQLNSDLNFTRP